MLTTILAIIGFYIIGFNRAFGWLAGHNSVLGPAAIFIHGQFGHLLLEMRALQ
jgi:hypothetical protein